jgi:simple sugar transport system substrate-binding protein
MKKMLLFFTVVAVLAVFVATGTAADKYVIANTPKSIGIAWWDRMQEGNQKFAAATGHEVYQSGPVGVADTAVQLAAIEDAIASGVHIINVIPTSPEATEPVLKRAMDQGIVVISHEAENMENVHYDLEAFVNEEYGAQIMDNLAAEMGEEGGYCIVVGALTMTSHMQWADGAVARQEAKYPKMFQVAPRVESAAQGGGTEGSYLVAKEVIARYPDIKGFMGCDMVDPPGIARAVEEAGKAGQIAVTGTCLVSVAREFLLNGTIKTISFWDPGDAGHAMCALGVKVLEGEEIKDGIDLGAPGYSNCTLKGKVLYGQAWVNVTIDNMADYDF